jgi:hypothetical protein
MLRRRFSPTSPKEGQMTLYSALTVRKLKPGTYDEWRKAWGTGEPPAEAEVYILRNLKNPDEIIAFGLIEGDFDEIKSSMDPDAEKTRQESMAPYVESVGADGVYEVIEHIGAKTGSRA